MTARVQTVTILFTDLVGSAELLQRAGDEQAQRIFKAHHRLLREAVEAHGSHEVKWLGDGLMVAFDSAHDAVQCAIAMQQSSRRPTAGQRLEIRAGLNVGEALVDESDYFGTPVVVARRLCDSASGGQIFASDIVLRLLDGRGADIATTDLGPLELKGITNKVPAVEIVYQHDPMALLRKLPFVGRAAEYETLTKKLAEARNGRGAVVLLGGEPGIGKTRLTEEFCEHASSGATVIRGNCYEGDGAAPFGPWTEALRSLIEQTPDADLRDTLGPGAPDIAVMMPEIKRRIPDLEEAPRLDPESERARLFESIGAFLRNAADKRPLVIFLDDLHWCDRPSLALLEQVARGTADRRIVIVGTYRDAEVDRVHPLAQTLAALRRMEHHERLAIHGLPRNDVDDLLTSIEPSEESRPVRRVLSAVLFRETEGNPLFIGEVMTHLIETGKIVHEGGRWTSNITNVADLGIPEGVREAIGRRLSRLSDGCNKMLQRLSAMTSGFTWDELKAICDDPEDALLDALDEALGSQLIAERSRGAYAFTHSLIRAMLYDELSTPRRVQLHRRVAEALEALYADDIEGHLGELAAHYMASSGGDAQKAIDYSIRAGDRARDLVAWEEAAAHYECALTAMDIAKAPEGERRCSVLLALSDCQHLAGQFAPTVEHTRNAVAIARALGSAELLAHAAIAFENAAQKAEQDLTAERVAVLDDALEMLGGQESSLRALTLGHRVQAASAFANSRGGRASAGFLAWAGEKDEAVLQQAREAVALAERVGDDIAIANSIYYLYSYMWTPDNDRERLELVDRGVAAARRARSGRLEVDLCFQRGSVLLALGELAEFRRNAEEHAAVLQRTRYGGERYGVLQQQVTLDMADGALSLAEQHFNDNAVNTTEGATAAVASVGQLYFLRLLQGRLAEVEPLFRGAVARWPGLPTMHAGLMVILGRTNQRPEVAAALDEFVQRGVAGVPRDLAWKATFLLLAEACADVEHTVSARLLYDVLLPYASSYATIASISTLGSIARVVGRLAALLERWDDAEQHFETALEANERMGVHAWTAWTRLNYGDMLLRRNRPGDRDRAVALLNEALDFARESGMGKVQADSERLLASLGPSSQTIEPAAVDVTFVPRPERAPESFAGGRYVVIRPLGAGGQKSVYLVHDEELDRECALALIKSDVLEPDDLTRFKREARAMARLGAHSNIVSVFDIGEQDGRPFLVSEYIAGGDLRQLLTKRGPLPLTEALAFAGDIARALAVAHARGVVHRDVKPLNIWLTEDGAAKLGDFGLAFSLDALRLTMPGTVMGTAAYLAPEQALGEAVTERTDLYALGCLLYEMVCGRLPFTDANPTAVIAQHLHAVPAAPSSHGADVPAALDGLILRLLSKSPAERPESASAVLEELRRMGEGAAY